MKSGAQNMKPVYTIENLPPESVDWENSCFMKMLLSNLLKEPSFIFSKSLSLANPQFEIKVTADKIANALRKK